MKETNPQKKIETNCHFQVYLFFGFFFQVYLFCRFIFFEDREIATTTVA